MAITKLSRNQFDNTPVCKAYRSAALVFATGTTDKVVNLDAVQYDSFGMYDAVNDRINITVSGLYAVIGRLSFSNPSTTGHRTVVLFINGVIAYRHPIITPRSGTAMHVHTSAVHAFTAGDYVQLYGWHTEGSDLDINVGDYLVTGLDVVWLGD